MPVYFVTGKLGTGKSLAALSKIRDYLNRGNPVCTNIDVYLDKLIDTDNKSARLTRIPDKPSADDLNAVGAAYQGDYDESKFGLMVFDELGSWLNSRKWNDKGRLAFIDWCIHARKLRWDILFLVQSIDMVDSQVREALCEYLVVCRRMDRLKAGVGPLKFQLPKLHRATVYYGDSAQPKFKEDVWWYRGHELYSAYDTAQSFSSLYDRGNYCVLPPGYLGITKQQEVDPVGVWENRLQVAAAGIIGAFAVHYLSPDPEPVLVTSPEQVADAPALSSGSPSYADSFGLVWFSGVMQFGGSETRLYESERYGVVDSDVLNNLGGDIVPVTECASVITWPDNSVTEVGCEAPEPVRAPGSLVPDFT
jgi:hypothetical protein